MNPLSCEAPTIILASASPRREQLLMQLCPHFKVIPSQVDESKLKAKTPEAFVVKAALAKANDVARLNPNSLVIGADTIVVLGRKILGKPKDEKHALTMLKSLTGRWHKVITGLAIVNSATGQTKTASVATQVKMKMVSLAVIKEYVDSGRPLDKAGGYGIQEIESTFIEKIVGDYDNVVGLPVKRLKQLLEYKFN
ncbi:septum formation protein Maf [Candidatus Saganbacteria bacterium]|nr:septum formation protein Maf [Candidatus Saganbacteria bacterium]